MPDEPFEKNKPHGGPSSFVPICTHKYIYIYVNIHIYTCIHTYIYIDRYKGTGQSCYQGAPAAARRDQGWGLSSQLSPCSSDGSFEDLWGCQNYGPFLGP